MCSVCLPCPPQSVLCSRPTTLTQPRGLFTARPPSAATTLHTTTELVQAAPRSTRVVRGWGVFERGAVERSKSREVVPGQWWASAVMRDDARTCVQSRMTHGVGVGPSAGCEGGDDQKPYFARVEVVGPQGRVLACVVLVIDEDVVSREALSLHAAVHAWLPFETDQGSGCGVGTVAERR